MNNFTIKKYIVLTLRLSIAISILVHFSSVFDEIFSNSFTEIKMFKYICNVLLELFITFFICFILFGLNFYILRPFQPNKISKPLSIFFAFLVSFTIVSILSHFLFDFKNIIVPKVDIYNNGKNHVFKDFFEALVVIVSVFVIKVAYQNQQNKLEIQSLKIENLQRQYDALKNQVSPHFLFNALNSLKTLIRESPDVAQEYVNQLSSVLRYTLKANESKLVVLNDELQFVASYFYLIKMRYSHNITMVQHINDKMLMYKIPPLAIQTLIENAVKHNEISKRNPLEILIYSSDNDTLIIKNNINKKFAQESGTGLGLVNLTNQYSILANKEIEITKDDTNFIVEIPLLKS